MAKRMQKNAGIQAAAEGDCQGRGGGQTEAVQDIR
jgi:hypothetical protein